MRGHGRTWAVAAGAAVVLGGALWYVAGRSGGGSGTAASGAAETRPPSSAARAAPDSVAEPVAANPASPRTAAGEDDTAEASSSGRTRVDARPPDPDGSTARPGTDGRDPDRPPTAEEIVRRAASAYDSLRSLRARFRQELEMRVFEPPRRREGEGFWYQRKPAYLRMDFSDPEGDVIVSDGDHLWLYYPSTHPGQVIRTGLTSPGRGAAVVDLQGRIFRRARTLYRPEYRGREDVTGRPAHLLELLPERTGTRYRQVRVWVDAQTHLLRKLEFHDRSETVRTITLDDLEPNVALPDSLFRFEPPPGAEVFGG